MQSKAKQLLTLISAAFIIIFIFSIFTAIQHAGKTMVEIRVLPKDATITIDGQASHAGNVYVARGTHLFKAARKDYTDDSRTVTVGQDKITVSLLPLVVGTPANTNGNADQIEKLSEKISAAKLEADNQAIIDKNPIVSQLPYPFDNLDGLTPRDYEISYEYNPGASKTGILIKIYGNTRAREAALEQIRMWAYDPSDLEIKYMDFTNPLANGGN
ncbi:MAG TPA: hypothetical protein VNX65_00125 [Patescibacteria group bacterium]|jgi:hypothetical protein|nr:hypothetical protein [Patescibacteria group bacterium]